MDQETTRDLGSASVNLETGWISFEPYGHLKNDEPEAHRQLVALGIRWKRSAQAYKGPWSPEAEDLVTALSDGEAPERVGIKVDYEAKAVRRTELAEKREADANQAADSSSRRLEGIPPGQPVLVGHHSEKRHRRALARSDADMRRALLNRSKAAYHRGRAGSLKRRAERQDDPQRIRNKLAELGRDRRRHQARIKRAGALQELRHSRWIELLSQRIGHFEQRLVDMGEPSENPVGPDSVKPGDQVSFMGSEYTALRVNQKSVTIEPWMFDGNTWKVPYSKLKPDDIRSLPPDEARSALKKSKARIRGYRDSRGDRD